MSQPDPRPAAPFRLTRMTARDPREPGRVASSLELFFDLVFVVAVSTASAHLHDAMTRGDVRGGLLTYALVFFTIWWAWMNFTWFATSFDADDWLYRSLTILQMFGVMILAAGIDAIFTEHEFGVAILGYVVMRVAMCAQWLRASIQWPATRRTTLVYAVGIGLAQVVWVSLLWIPDHLRTPAFAVMILMELAVPVLAERPGRRTTWHPHHITERYSLFTLIVMGESLLASANAIFAAFTDHGRIVPLLGVAALALVSTAALWWIYFWPEHHRAIGGFGQSLAYGYGHYLVFAAAGAFSVGIALLVDARAGTSALSERQAVATFAVAVATWLAVVWALAIRRCGDRLVNVAVPVAVLLVLLCPMLPWGEVAATLVLVGVVAVLVTREPVEARVTA